MLYNPGMDPGAPLQFDAVPVPTPAGGPLAVELVPAPDPWAVARRLAHLPHLLFLDSAEKHPNRGRYSYVSADPVTVHVDHEDVGRLGYTPPKPWNFLRSLATAVAKWTTEQVPALPPFQGGFAGLFGYGLC